VGSTPLPDVTGHDPGADARRLGDHAVDVAVVPPLEESDVTDGEEQLAIDVIADLDPLALDRRFEGRYPLGIHGALLCGIEVWVGIEVTCDDEFTIGRSQSVQCPTKFGHDWRGLWRLGR
jgi:hypothetical protein